MVVVLETSPTMDDQPSNAAAAALQSAALTRIIEDLTYLRLMLYDIDTEDHNHLSSCDAATHISRSLACFVVKV
jgi:hypothetical protein